MCEVECEQGLCRDGGQAVVEAESWFPHTAHAS